MNLSLSIRRVQLLLLTILFVAATTAAAQSESRLYTYSTLDGLLAGVYDGELTIAHLHSKGNFGLGTFNHLDGEMVLLDGICYHVRADGTVSVARPQDKSPLAYATHFRPTQAIRPERVLPLPDLEKWLDTHLQNKNLFLRHSHRRALPRRFCACDCCPGQTLQTTVRDRRNAGGAKLQRDARRAGRLPQSCL